MMSEGEALEKGIWERRCGIVKQEGGRVYWSGQFEVQLASSQYGA